MADLCPACATRPQEDPETGWCRACTERRKVETYMERKDRAARARSDAWRTWTRAAWQARQRNHRLMDRLRPRRPAPPGADPLELAARVLEVLEELRGVAALSSAAVHLDLEEAADLVRALAWGPEPGTRL